LGRPAPTPRKNGICPAIFTSSKEITAEKQGRLRQHPGKPRYNQATFLVEAAAENPRWKRGNRTEVTEMSWDKGRYYTRSKKVNGRVVREYIGTGDFAELVAKLDALEREQRELEHADEKALRNELTALDGTLSEMDSQAEVLARAALIVAGYHQHHRSEWRKRRGDWQPTESASSDRPEGTPEDD
jgi:hypothetical protein